MKYYIFTITTKKNLPQKNAKAGGRNCLYKELYSGCHIFFSIFLKNKHQYQINFYRLWGNNFSKTFLKTVATYSKIVAANNELVLS